ncbi:uncharacterized protein LOC144009794 [Festucalex cinctus]
MQNLGLTASQLRTHKDKQAFEPQNCLTKGGDGSAQGESLEEVVNVLAEEGSDWLYGFFTFLFDVVGSPVEQGEEEDGGEEEEEEEEDGEEEAAAVRRRQQGNDRKLKGSRRKQALRKALREVDEDPDEMELNEDIRILAAALFSFFLLFFLCGVLDEIPEVTTLRRNATRELPVRDDVLRSALRDELSAIDEKTEAKRIARVALSEIKNLLLADERRGREAAWQLQMKTLEVAQEQLGLEKERIGVEKERMEVEKRRMEAERERMAWEKAENERRERDKAEREEMEKERTAWEKAKRERAERERIASQQEREQLEKKEKERLVREQVAAKEREERERLAREKSEEERKERERIAQETARQQKEQMAKERERLEKEKLERERQEKERAEKERLAKERAEKEKAAREKEVRLSRDKMGAERPEVRKANSSQPPEEKSQRAGVTAVRREKGVVADKMAATGRKK